MRILISRTDVLGDAVVTSAFIESLASSIDNVKIDVLCNQQNYPAFKYNPFLNKIYILDHQQGTKKLADNYKQLTSEINSSASYDYILQLNGCIRAYQYISLLTSGKIYARKLITSSFKANLWMLRTKLTGKFVFYKENTEQHEVIRLHQFLDFFLAAIATPKRYTYPQYARFYLENMSLLEDKDKKSIVLNVSGKKEFARYMNDSMLYALLKQLSSWNVKLGLVLMPDDKKRVDEVIASLENNVEINFIMSTDINQLANMIARYEFFIGVDGGLVHIAAGLGLKCVVLFDKQDSKIWHAWTPLQKSLQSINRNIYDISYLDVIDSLMELRNAR